MASTKRLVLPFEDGRPTGYTLERLTRPMLDDQDNCWTLIAGKRVDARPAVMRRVPGYIVKMHGFVDMYSDADDRMYTNPTHNGGLYDMYRIRFDAGPIAGYTRVDSDIAPGIVLWDDKRMFLLFTIDPHQHQLVSIVDVHFHRRTFDRVVSSLRYLRFYECALVYASDDAYVLK